MNAATKLCLVDADGTVRFNRADPDQFINDPRDVEIPLKVREALIEERNAGWSVAIISNQAGVEFGHLTLADTIAGFAVTIAQSNSIITTAYWCTDMVGNLAYRLRICPKSGKLDLSSLTTTENEALCGQFRKPSIGLGLVAMNDYGVGPEHTKMIGDMESDLRFAEQLGIPFTWAKDWWGPGY